jgi:hypothetical protein
MDERIVLANKLKTPLDAIFYNMGYKSPITSEVINEDGDVYLRIDEGEIDVFIDTSEDTVFMDMTILTYKHHSGSYINPPEVEEIEHGTFNDMIKLIQAVINLEVKMRIDHAFESVEESLRLLH